MAEQPPSQPFFTVKQLAARWQVSERKIRRMIDQRKLSAVEIGAHLRIPVDEVERYEARNTTGSRP